ncbi:hypothetical protein ZOD2009_19373 [Haladaptatus paucihalophilus DX253]|uniref:Uncharacterized protein n=1 Tax=Haladaptatus paucihalophilus DX253 TaxID=797209 RepID=E7QYI4_HALPU|nr:hypothetical protein ZOD2009_19373 [Haladaptatus paucihalophilus DX253]
MLVIHDNNKYCSGQRIVNNIANSAFFATFQRFFLVFCEIILFQCRIWITLEEVEELFILHRAFDHFCCSFRHGIKYKFHRGQ